MKTRGFIFLVVAGLLLLDLQGVQAKDLKIGVVDFQKVLEKSTVIGKMNKQLEEQIKAEEKVITDRKESLQKKKDQWEKQKSVLSQEVRTEKEEQLRQELKDLQRYAKDKQDAFQRKGSELMQDVVKELSQIVEEIGQKEGYTSIVERSTGGVVYFSSSSDLTDAVIKEYDKRHKD